MPLNLLARICGRYIDVSDEENEEDDSDVESEVIDPPYMDMVTTHRMGHNNPIAPWAHDIWRWSRHQGMRPPFGMDRGFFDLSHGGPADRALPVRVRQTRDIDNQDHLTANQMDEMRAAVERVERQTQAVVREYQEWQATLKARMRVTERQLARLQEASTSSLTPQDTSWHE